MRWAWATAGDPPLWPDHMMSPTERVPSVVGLWLDEHCTPGHGFEPKKKQMIMRYCVISEEIWFSSQGQGMVWVAANIVKVTTSSLLDSNGEHTRRTHTQNTHAEHTRRTHTQNTGKHVQKPPQCLLQWVFWWAFDEPLALRSMPWHWKKKKCRVLERF